MPTYDEICVARTHPSFLSTFKFEVLIISEFSLFHREESDVQKVRGDSDNMTEPANCLRAVDS